MNDTEGGAAQPRDLRRDIWQAVQIVIGIIFSVAFWWGLLWIIPSNLFGLHWYVPVLVLPLIAALLVAGIVHLLFKQLRIAVVAFLFGILVVEFIALIFELTMFE